MFVFLVIPLIFVVRKLPIVSIHFDNSEKSADHIDSSIGKGSKVINGPDNSINGQGNVQKYKKGTADTTIRNSFNKIEVNLHTPNASEGENTSDQTSIKVQPPDRPIFNSQGGRGEASSVMSSYWVVTVIWVLHASI